MDKQYALEQVQRRLDQLHMMYGNRCDCRNDDGMPLSYSGAAFARSKITQDINLCMLVKELLEQSRAVFLSKEAVKGLDRLIEPQRRK